MISFNNKIKVLMVICSACSLFTGGSLYSQDNWPGTTRNQISISRAQRAQRPVKSIKPDKLLPFSLWKNKIQPLYQFPFQSKAPLTEGDYVLVIVDENSTASITADTDLKRTVEYQADLKDFLQYKGLSNLMRSAGTSPGIDLSSQSRTKGLGRRNRRDRITFRLETRIAWDLGDGTLFIIGRKTLQLHDEKTIFTISGNIKKSDVVNNMISSSLIHDLHLSYSGSGALASNYTQSIWGKILDWIWF